MDAQAHASLLGGLTEALGRLSSSTSRLSAADTTTQAAVALTSLGAALALHSTCVNAASTPTPPSPPPSSSPLASPKAVSFSPTLVQSVQLVDDDTSAERTRSGSWRGSVQLPEAQQAQSLQAEVAALRRTLDEVLADPPTPSSSELLSEIALLRSELADARRSSKSAWKARAEDWKAFEVERASTKLALADATRFVKEKAEDAVHVDAARAAGAAAAALELKLDQPQLDSDSDGHHHHRSGNAPPPQESGVAHSTDLDLERKGSPAGGTVSSSITAEQVNVAIREILSPVPVPVPVPVVHGVLSPRDDNHVNVVEMAQPAANDAGAGAVPPSIKSKRRPRNWSRHKGGASSSGSSAAATSTAGAPRGLQALGGEARDAWALQHGPRPHSIVD
jgi:hypothetical protein